VPAPSAKVNKFNSHAPLRPHSVILAQVLCVKSHSSQATSQPFSLYTQQTNSHLPSCSSVSCKTPDNLISLIVRLVSFPGRLVYRQHDTRLHTADTQLTPCSTCSPKAQYISICDSIRNSSTMCLMLCCQSSRL